MSEKIVNKKTTKLSQGGFSYNIALKALLNHIIASFDEVC
ncbi:hypothetical protein DFQ05_0233 [Winogradskyella wandonensis]|uniref:Uncharacterized protein n=1 Tax=Winogradskyella wandonensis TaxID=1442586 RepID=A0A4R1KVJ2_9FLAO|nr:hypothetical protein DFQ05_0233 [Winogradskyella wandonensis]